MNPARQIAAAIDRHLLEPADIVVFGSCAMLLDHRFDAVREPRMTDDMDIIIPGYMEAETELRLLSAFEGANRDLQPSGLYVTHIYPEEMVVLSRDWREHIVKMPSDLPRLHLSRPRTLDLILTKMGRGDRADLKDVAVMLKMEHEANKTLISQKEIATAAASANVPKEYADIFVGARDRILSLAGDFHKALAAGGEIKGLTGRLGDVGMK